MNQTRITPKRKLIILTAGLYFCLTLLFDWLGIKQGTAFPATWFEGLAQVAAALVETAIFTLLFFFAWTYVLGRLLNGGRNPGSRNESGRRPGT